TRQDHPLVSTFPFLQLPPMNSCEQLHACRYYCTIKDRVSIISQQCFESASQQGKRDMSTKIGTNRRSRWCIFCGIVVLASLAGNAIADDKARNDALAAQRFELMQKRV